MEFDSELTERVWNISRDEGVVAQEQLGYGLFILVGEIDHLIPGAEYAILTVRNGECAADFYDDMESAFAEWHDLTGHEMD